jgi:lipopolysaccharide export system protein LptA
MIRDKKSVILILVFVGINAVVIFKSLQVKTDPVKMSSAAKAVAPEYTVIDDLDYFNTREGVPQLSLQAQVMRSMGEEYAEFENPKGVYNYQKTNETLRYQAGHAVYKKPKDLLTLTQEVKISSEKADYYADKVNYYLKKDLITGKGNVKFLGSDPKTRDSVDVRSVSMKAYPQRQYGFFTGSVTGLVQRKKKYEGALHFSSDTLELKGAESLAHLESNVRLKRDEYLITGGKADIYLENFNKSLKYFVMNDDVKLTENLKNPQGGVTQRKAFAERLEGFGREQKMVLSGAPRVEQGTDVVKGYRITFRQQVDLLEIDDAMTDMKMKKKEKTKGLVE